MTEYIPLSQIVAYLTAGWNVVPMELPHGQYSALAWREADG